MVRKKHRIEKSYRKGFNQVSIQHVYWEFNQVAYIITKHGHVSSPTCAGLKIFQLMFYNGVTLLFIWCKVPQRFFCNVCFLT